VQSQIVAKGTLSNGKLAIKEARGQQDEVMLSRIVAAVSSRIPSFVVDSLNKPRTMVFDDIDGYTFIKFFLVQVEIQVVFIRISRIIYSGDEMKNISMQLS